MMNLDLSGVVEQDAAVPDSTYNVVVEKAELADTKSGGKMIKIQTKIMDGPAKGRNLFTQFNIENANPQAVQISLGQLKSMMTSFGHKNPNKLESCNELVGLRGSVKTKLKTDDYGTKAEIKSYGPVATGDTATTQAATPLAAQNPFG